MKTRGLSFAVRRRACKSMNLPWLRSSRWELQRAESRRRPEARLAVPLSGDLLADPDLVTAKARRIRPQRLSPRPACAGTFAMGAAEATHLVFLQRQ